MKEIQDDVWVDEWFAFGWPCLTFLVFNIISMALDIHNQTNRSLDQQFCVFFIIIYLPTVY